MMPIDDVAAVGWAVVGLTALVGIAYLVMAWWKS